MPPDETIIVTGADSAHFANLEVLLCSWWTNMRSFPLAVCDYGLQPRLQDHYENCFRQELAG